MTGKLFKITVLQIFVLKTRMKLKSVLKDVHHRSNCILVVVIF
jgi:hypothetical protein